MYYQTLSTLSILALPARRAEDKVHGRRGLLRWNAERHLKYIYEALAGAEVVVLEERPGIRHASRVTCKPELQSSLQGALPPAMTLRRLNPS
jgi:hypothetical protein